MTASEDPEERTGPDDPRVAWSVRSVDLIMSAHVAGVAPSVIAHDLHLPLREVSEVIRRRCDQHSHTFVGVVVAGQESP